MNMLECRLAGDGVAIGDLSFALPGLDQAAIPAGAKIRADAPIPADRVQAQFERGRRVLYANDRLAAVG